MSGLTDEGLRCDSMCSIPLLYVTEYAVFTPPLVGRNRSRGMYPIITHTVYCITHHVQDDGKDCILDSEYCIVYIMMG